MFFKELFIHRCNDFFADVNSSGLTLDEIGFCECLKLQMIFPLSIKSSTKGMNANKMARVQLK